jgi:hypothetical protein
MFTKNKMFSHNYSEGRPHQDGGFQNLRTVSTLTASKLTAGEINSNVVASTHVISENASITNLTATNLTLHNMSNLSPFLGYVNLPLPVATLGGGATYSLNGQPYIRFYSPNNDTASWSVLVPASESQLRIYVPVLNPLISDILTVTVNGTSYQVTNTSLKSGSNYIYSTAAFDWATSAVMNVRITPAVLINSMGNLSIGDAVYVGL